MSFLKKTVRKLEGGWPKKKKLSGENVTSSERYVKASSNYEKYGTFPVACYTFFGDEVSDILDNYLELGI
jgi:hypothetical protein